MAPNLSVVLLHESMNDKQGKIVTTSLTTIDMHDLARSSRTYGCSHFFVAHPSPLLQKLALRLRAHWLSGYGSTYNENRRQAFDYVEVTNSLDETIAKFKLQYGLDPILVATSAKPGGNRISFRQFREKLQADSTPYLLMLGTGWGMSDALLSRAQYFLEPVNGPEDYNHLSVRSACAVMLDRLMGQHS